MFRTTMPWAVIQAALLSVALVQGQISNPIQVKGKLPPAPPVRQSPSAAKALSRVDEVIQLKTAGMTDAFLIKTLQAANKPILLSTSDLLKLQQAGVSENVMSVMLDPKADVPVKPQQPETQSPKPPDPDTHVHSESTVRPPTPSAPTGGFRRLNGSSEITSMPVASATRPVKPKLRVLIEPFDYATVLSQVQAIFGTQFNIGKGIQSMLTTRVQNDGQLIPSEDKLRDKLITIQSRNAGDTVKRGSGARMGRANGVDVVLAGDITIFGRDDRRKGAGGSIWTGWCSFCGSVASARKEEKAVVGLNYRLIDAETLDTIASGVQLGESKRTSMNLGAALSSWRTGGGGASVDMSSSNFQETIIGEATQDCVNKLSQTLSAQLKDLKPSAREIEARVAFVSEGRMAINVGSGEGVNLGDVFEIFRIDSEVKDPLTSEVIDQIVTKVGEMPVAEVRERMSTGSYRGGPVAVGFVARKKLQ